MHPLYPRYAATEDALYLLAQAAVEVHLQDASDECGTNYDIRAHHQMQLVRLMSIVEAFLDRLCHVLLEDLIPTRDAAIDKLFEDAIVNYSSTWQARVDAFDRHLGVRLAGCKCWGEISAAKDVRNAVAHGLGRLTAKQRAGKDLRNALKAIHVHISDGQLFFGVEAIERVYACARSFICDVDRASSLAATKRR